MEKGILGLKTDPKKKMLFFFNGETWPSDDSEDESYIPSSAKIKGVSPTVASASQEIITNIPKKRRKKKKEGDKIDPPAKRKRNHKKSIIPGQSTSLGIKTVIKKETLNADFSTEPPGPWGTVIPPDILVKIFKFVIKMDGAVQFLNRAAKVCILWKRVSYFPVLWEVMDLSSPKLRNEEKFIWFCKNRLSQLKELNLSQWGNALTHKGIKAITENCPRLTNINLSGCKKLSASDIRSLADCCTNLSTIDLSYTANCSGAENPVSNNTLKYFMGKCGKNIVSFSMANNRVTGIHLIVNTICESCPSLKVLDISNMEASNRDLISINIEKLQEGCPQLQVLRLANTSIRLANVPLNEQVISPGFPKLKELSLAARGDSYASTIEDTGLDRILKASEQLKLLDLRGCKRITTSSLVKIPAWNLQHVFLSQCSAAMDPQLELVMQKWKHSLIEVDLSWNNHINESIDLAINALTSDPETSKLQALDLCGSSVTFEPVKNVLDKCKHLRTLNLSSCRGLPRGMKRLYVNGELELLKANILSAKFESAKYEEVT